MAERDAVVDDSSNNGTIFDPRAGYATIPLRFSSDPATVFLPTTHRSDP